MRLVLILLSLLAFTSSIDAFFYPKTVKSLDVSAYLGRWKQVYANFVVFSTIEKDAVCVTADYGLAPDGTSITVRNANRVKTVDGPVNSIEGIATTPDPSEPGQLKVQFPVSPVPGDYWIIALGPIIDGQYQYSIVTDPMRLNLFVLTRDVDTFYAKYNTEVRKILFKNWFVFPWNKPIKSVTEGCTFDQ